MLPTLHRMTRQLKNNLMSAFTDAVGAGQGWSHPQPEPRPSTPDWRIPAYLRRRVSGDALACPWPPRQR